MCLRNLRNHFATRRFVVFPESRWTGMAPLELPQSPGLEGLKKKLQRSGLDVFYSAPAKAEWKSGVAILRKHVNNKPCARRSAPNESMLHDLRLL